LRESEVKRVFQDVNSFQNEFVKYTAKQQTHEKHQNKVTFVFEPTSINSVRKLICKTDIN